ncbi:MAG: sigma-54 dependent transcriptional regulator [Nitrospiraceae bacterium]|jgi:two-component system response regulator AtoC|uniref:sigma-54-dependent transcriptional regulator n=1 Tax=Nitrospira cf. moscoviensis SBR1015 TaxID=96242 RepID=UPI000A0C9981|nr:sigma-54 dependent transcriptional regulator [Nitrospira cf. moscoviensis SBR1015]MBY0249714.1 sigma-54 dependent transcriptional regulator [Nitrospiraceae bacterium]OQW37479.1 MAG: sigma-54-dependent Fis family transcriptional regulator [Nitrospira sp. SG-bin2]
MTWQLLLVEDEPSVREAFALRLGDQGYVVQTAGSGEEALSLLRSFEPDILVLDLVMPNLSGLDVLARVKQTSPNLLVILLTARGTVKDAVEATKLGAFDFVAKSIDMEDLLHALHRATELLTLQRQVRLQSGQEVERYALDRVLAKSHATQAFLAQVRELAKNDRVTVLLQGETGTGKQYMGRVIHYNGPRARKPCIEVDCPSIPRELFESELFGHEKGAFTGAAGRKTGLIEMADGGTVLFDEIGDLPLTLQAKLLRVIEERTLRRVGGSATIPVDVRFMAATNRNLKDAVAKSEFREDLYFRLNVVTLTVPPLRERQEDIIPLAERFLTRSALSLRKPVRCLGDSARVILCQYHFPGNVRELSNLMERAVLFCPGDTLESVHFPSDVQDKPSRPVADTAYPPSTASNTKDPSRIHLSFHLGESLADLDDRIINTVLKHADGNKSLAAKHLGITRWMLDRRRKSKP